MRPRGLLAVAVVSLSALSASGCVADPPEEPEEPQGHAAAEIRPGEKKVRYELGFIVRPPPEWCGSRPCTFQLTMVVRNGRGREIFRRCVRDVAEVVTFSVDYDDWVWFRDGEPKSLQVVVDVDRADMRVFPDLACKRSSGFTRVLDDRNDIDRSRAEEHDPDGPDFDYYRFGAAVGRTLQTE
jgi:hypothetical protein